MTSAAARPVFGQPLSPERYEARIMAGGPIVQLCTEPVRTAPIGRPCHRCLANKAAPGQPVACHFLRGTKP